MESSIKDKDSILSHSSASLPPTLPQLPSYPWEGTGPGADSTVSSPVTSNDSKRASSELRKKCIADAYFLEELKLDEDKKEYLKSLVRSEQPEKGPIIRNSWNSRPIPVRCTGDMFVRSASVPTNIQHSNHPRFKESDITFTKTKMKPKNLLGMLVSFLQTIWHYILRSLQGTNSKSKKITETLDDSDFAFSKKTMNHAYDRRRRSSIGSQLLRSLSSDNQHLLYTDAAHLILSQ